MPSDGCFVCEGEIGGKRNYAVPRYEDMIDPSSAGCSDVCERCYYIATALLAEARSVHGYDRPISRLEVLSVISKAPENELVCEALTVHREYLSTRGAEVVRVKALLGEWNDPRRKGSTNAK